MSSLISLVIQNIADPKVEPWKREALSGLPQQSDSKVESLFGPQLREWLRERLSSYEELYAASSLSYNREEQLPPCLSPCPGCDIPRKIGPEANVGVAHTVTDGRYRVA